MEERNSTKVCVTGGSGYIASWLVKKLLEKGYTVHATLRNLDEKIKVDPLKSLTYADTRLVLFQADIYNPSEFESAIEGCHYVFHLATPLQHNSQSSKYKDTTEAAIAGVKSIADCCIRSGTVKRLIYTASMMSLSPLKEDRTGYKSSCDESCWTPLNFSSMFAPDYALALLAESMFITHLHDHRILNPQVFQTNRLSNSMKGLNPEIFDSMINKPLGDDVEAHNIHKPSQIFKEYTNSKTLAEKEVLRYNEIENGKLEVVSLPCGLVGGDNTVLPKLPLSVNAFLSPITGNLSLYDSLRFLQELLGLIPLLHIDDVCEAHIFCLEKESLRGRFVCNAVDTSVQEIASYHQENYPLFKISHEFKGGPDIGSSCDNTKLMRMGFEYKYGVKDTLDSCVDFGRRLQAFSSD